MAENLCPKCGAANAPQAKFCGTCGATLPAPAYNPPPPPTNYVGPGSSQPQPTPPGSNSKAVLALVLGIASVFCCGPFTGIPAAIIGKMEMDAIKQGRSPEANMGMAKAGFWIGIVGTGLFILSFILMFVFGLLSSLTNYMH